MATYPFSDELRKLQIEEAVGKTIVCEDGVARRVVEIIPCYRWPWRCVINEKDPNSQMGYFVNCLSLAAQLLGKPIPDKEGQEAFAKAMRIKFSISEDGFGHEKEAKKVSRLYVPQKKKIIYH